MAFLHTFNRVTCRPIHFCTTGLSVYFWDRSGRGVEVESGSRWKSGGGSYSIIIVLAYSSIYVADKSII